MKTIQQTLNHFGLIDSNGEVHSYPDELAPAMEAYASQFKPQWIPVSERLPEVDERVLVLNYEGRLRIMRFDGKHFVLGDSALLSPTYWLPLPQQPEE